MRGRVAFTTPARRTLAQKTESPTNFIAKENSRVEKKDPYTQVDKKSFSPEKGGRGSDAIPGSIDCVGDRVTTTGRNNRHSKVYIYTKY